MCRATDAISKEREFRGERCDSITVGVELEAVMATAYGMGIDPIVTPNTFEASLICDP